MLEYAWKDYCALARGDQRVPPVKWLKALQCLFFPSCIELRPFWGTHPIQPLSISNLNDALQYAEQDIKDRWQWYKERYVKRSRR